MIAPAVAALLCAPRLSAAAAGQGFASARPHRRRKHAIRRRNAAIQGLRHSTGKLPQYASSLLFKPAVLHRPFRPVVGASFLQPGALPQPAFTKRRLCRQESFVPCLLPPAAKLIEAQRPQPGHATCIRRPVMIWPHRHTNPGSNLGYRTACAHAYGQRVRNGNKCAPKK